MDKRRRIPVTDVKQIAYEVGLWSIDIERLRAISELIGKPSDIEFKEKFDSFIEARIQMVIDRIDCRE